MNNPIGEETADDGYPVHTTIFNVLPTVAAQNEPHIPEIHNSDTGAISQAITNQQQTAGVSGSNIFDLDIREVLGIDTGYRGKSPFGHYGDSEDYFVVIGDQIAYCHKRKATYNPGTAVLVLEDERMASDPGGGFSDHEKFVLWKYCFENNLIPNTQTPPKGGLIEYGKRNGVITDADIEIREGKYGNFRAIADFHTKLDTLKHIGERYGFDVDPMIDAMLSNDSDTNSDSSTNTDSDQPTDSASQSESETQHTESQASDVESDNDGQESATSSAAERETTSTDTASASSTDTTSDDNTWTDTTPSSEGNQAPSDDTTDDDSAPVTVEEVSGQGKPDPDQLQDTTTNPDGPDASEIFDDESDSNNGETATDDTSESDEYIRFQTYKEPAQSDDEYDVDAEAVRQFVDEFTITEPADQNDLKCHKQSMLDAFTVWSEINNIELDALASGEYDGHRKSDLFNIISEQQEISEGLYTVRGNRKRGYSGISLSENGEELLGISIE